MSNPLPYDRNEPYNHLPFLPPSDDKVLTVELLLALNKANKALAELKGLARIHPNQSMLVNTLALREAKASLEIENIFTTDDELYKALSGNDQSLNGNAKEVLRYRQALWKGHELITRAGQFSVGLMVELYREIKQVNDGIRPPQTETTIKRRGSGVLGGTIVYTPPRGEKIIEQKLENLNEYLNDDNKYPYDPLIKMAVAHYQFDAIHPFRDGNGRTGRIINILSLLQKGLLEVPILYLSSYIITNKDSYYHSLNGVTTRLNWYEWILYIMKAIEETSVFTIQKITEIDRLYKRTIELAHLKLPHINTEVIGKVFEQPYINPRNLVDQKGLSRVTGIKSLNTAKKYLKQLEELKILVSKKVGKEVIYLNIDLFNLLSES